MSVPSFRWPQNSTSRLRPESNHFVNELWILIFRKECHLQNLLVCTLHFVFSAGFVQNLLNHNSAMVVMVGGRMAGSFRGNRIPTVFCHCFNFVSCKK
jgi:hypothetical protein